ncbi:MAG: VacJ family lipoprotein [Rickettsiaceae bacterium]|nr:VacJ family lipoprotein [Rickettsiaceae bacterium]
MKKNYIGLVLLGVLTFSLTSYAENAKYEFSYDLDVPAKDNQCNDLRDPFEPLNRKFFYFNSFLDMIILQPIAVAYDRVVPSFAKTRVGDFVDNIYEPLTAVNFVLQGNFKSAIRSVSKFVLNSTLGIGGTFDIGSKKGFTHKLQTFGSTLARYGARPGPYLVLPILGSTNMRDMWDGIVFDDALNPIKYGIKPGIKNTYTVVRVIQKRQEVLPFTDYIKKTSSDPYVSVRSALHQRRESMLVYPASYKCGEKIK